MIAAILASREETGRSVLNALTNAAGQEPVWARVNGGSALAVWDGVPPGQFDANAGLAWVGALRGRRGFIDLPACDGLWGDFALAALRSDGLLLARGRFGGRPLYYARLEDGRTFVACSRLQPLVCILGQRAPLDVTSLCAFVSWSAHADHTRTVYSTIRRLPSGTAVNVGSDGAILIRPLPFRAPPPIKGPAKELAREFRSQIVAAVTRSIAGMKRVAVMTGGGVDSSMLLASAVAVARGARPMEVDAIALYFAGRGDDRPYLEALCKSLNIVPVRFAPCDGAPYVAEERVADAAPYARLPCGWPVASLRLARERGADAVLTGFFGEEISEGDDRLFVHDFPRRPIRTLLGIARLQGPQAATPRMRFDRFFRSPLQRRLTPAWVRDRARAWRRHRNVDAHPWAGEALREFLRSNDPSWLDEKRARIHVGKFEALASAAYVTDVRDGASQLEALSSCLYLTPYSDERLVEFAAALPPESCFYDGRLRGLFRAAMEGLVPDVVRFRSDRAFFSNAHREVYLAMGGRSAVSDLLDLRELEQLDILVPRKFRKAFDRFDANPGDREADWPELWPAISAEAFVRWVRSGRSTKERRSRTE